VWVGWGCGWGQLKDKLRANRAENMARFKVCVRAEGRGVGRVWRRGPELVVQLLMEIRVSISIGRSESCLAATRLARRVHWPSLVPYSGRLASL
jgi:hypothetical protein